jgi:lysophospholipase L1-like esterase
MEKIMANILCFGDSNTWGFDSQLFQISKTIAKLERSWAEIVKINLDERAEIIIDGLNGRTTTFDDSEWLNRNGKKQLAISLEVHAPLALVVIMLGTNDLKAKYGKQPAQICLSIKELIDQINSAKGSIYGQVENPDILIVSPPHIAHENAFDAEFKGAIDKLSKLVPLIRKLAKEKNTFFLDINNEKLSLADDGIHLSQEGHFELAQLIQNYIDAHSLPYLAVTKNK